MFKCGLVIIIVQIIIIIITVDLGNEKNYFTGRTSQLGRIKCVVVVKQPKIPNQRVRWWGICFCLKPWKYRK